MEPLMATTLEQAEPVITKWEWDAESSGFANITSLFYENRSEAMSFIKQVNRLHKAMHLLARENSSSKMLVRSQILMQTAMKRLQNEFYQILSMNQAYLDPMSVSTRSSTSTRGDDSTDEIRVLDRLITEVEDASAVAMIDLKMMAECMIANGYAKECVHIYKLMRKSIVDEGVYKLGVRKYISLKKIQKMEWEVLDLKIKCWLEAVNVSVNSLFNGEKLLCDYVFASSNAIRESCFNEITNEGAILLFGFPEIVMKNKKNSPERIFRKLDMYTAIASNWLKIESIFSFDSTSHVVNLALLSTIKLGELVRAALTDFHATIQKDSSKTSVPGAGVHHLTTNLMNFISLLADYNVLGDILIDSPPSDISSLSISFFDNYDTRDSLAPPVSHQLAWLILSLICKLDQKAEQYKDVSFSYLFLANNLQHIISKVHTSNLKHLLGNEWISKHEAKVKLLAEKYEQLGWSQVIKAIPTVQTAAMSLVKVKERLKRFNAVFEEVHRRQSLCIIPDSKLRDEIKVSIANMLLPLYREFYNTHSTEMREDRNFAQLVRFAPEDLGNALSDLFLGRVILSLHFLPHRMHKSLRLHTRAI